MKILYTSILYLLSSFWIIANAQIVDSTKIKEDPYSDYSHLWEEETTSKKKKKKVKEQKPSEPVKQEKVVTDTSNNAGEDVSVDSAPEKVSVIEASYPTDSLPKSKKTVTTDTIPKQIPVVTDTTIREQPSMEEDAQQLDTEVVQEDSKQKKEKKKKESSGFSLSSLERVDSDFRSAPNGGSSGGGNINGGVTFTQIGDQYYAGLTLQPEFSIWKIGVGLNVPILFNLQDQTFRSEIFEDGVGIARSITYLRFGVQKKDPIYVRVGELNGIMIGFGGLINNYTNSTSFEKRKVGAHYDFNFKGLLGVEGMYSDFDPTSSNLLVTRPYIRPLGFLSIPIVRTLEIGASFVRDRDQTAIPLSDSTSTTYSFTQNDGVGAFGIDAGINLLSIPFVNIDAFFNYSRLNLTNGGLQDTLSAIGNPAGSLLENGYEDGSGSSYGVNFRFNFIADVLKTDIRIERLNYSEHYLPQFFDFSYELNKDARILATTGAEQKSGIYGSLTGHILQTIQLGGSLMIPDGVSEESPAVVQVNANAERVADKFSLQGTYLKGNLADLSDAFKLDERSIAKVRLIYHVNKFLAAGLDYYWAFTPLGDGSVEATKYVSPYFGVSIKL